MIDFYCSERVAFLMRNLGRFWIFHIIVWIINRVSSLVRADSIIFHALKTQIAFAESPPSRPECNTSQNQ